MTWIMRLYCPQGFELDPTYSMGNFYKGGIPQPALRFDLEPQISGVTQADCRHLPILSETVGSIMFDPPFVAGKGRDGKPGIIRTRFGSYKTMNNDLWPLYWEALSEFHRVLKPNGVLVFKCQDSVSSGNQFLSHVEIINVSYKLGFYPKDLFILVAKNRLMSPNMATQYHARKFHCYFLVFLKQKSPVEYS